MNPLQSLRTEVREDFRKHLTKKFGGEITIGEDRYAQDSFNEVIDSIITRTVALVVEALRYVKCDECGMSVATEILDTLQALRETKDETI